MYQKRVKQVKNKEKMKYMGSKARIAKHILPIILKDRKEGQWYVDAFCGGCNTLDKVTSNRVGCDSNPDVISAMISIRDHVNDLPKDNCVWSGELANTVSRGNSKKAIEKLFTL